MNKRLRELLDLIKDIVIRKETGKIEINLSQGGITRVEFNKKLM